ncbi:MAG: type II toxin-antitoxin system prevent-host-death family antitoxin [Campylobacterota bacterium]|nr:type II toxin-antitoxin system prevent-host-death family antitoxin [Campylobacterota bacterium]
MFATAKDLRFNISMLFDLLTKGEDITITYRGKPRAKLIPFNADEPSPKSSEMFGMLKDEAKDVDTTVRDMRKGRNFAL